MLLFEFFPAFIALVSLAVAVGLFVANRRAPLHASQPDQVTAASSHSMHAPALRHTGGRPSMRG